jgi:hypothetical protein
VPDWLFVRKDFRFKPCSLSARFPTGWIPSRSSALPYTANGRVGAIRPKRPFD